MLKSNLLSRPDEDILMSRFGADILSRPALQAHRWPA